MSNFMENPYPYSLRSGFWVFLMSERARHLEDVRKIDEMIAKLEEMTPQLKDGEVRNILLEFSRRFVDFNL